MLGSFQESCQLLGKLMLLKLAALNAKDWEGYEFWRRQESQLRGWLARQS